MRSRNAVAAAAACLLVLGMSACGSDDEEDGGGSAADAGGGGGTLTVGLMTSYSGPAAVSKGGKSEVTFQARIDAYREAGGECADIEFELVTADDTSTPQGALAAFQQLATQEEPFVILDDSQLFFAAAQYATTQAADIPVLGVATDGAPEWQDTGNNLFPAFPVPLPGTVFSTTGEFLASRGATKIAGIAFATPSSQQSLADVLASAEAAGLERGYVNDSMPLGSEDVSAIVLGIMDSGADAVYLPINANSIVAIAQGLQQADYPMKAILAATGYGASLLESEPAVAASQGVYYTSAVAPVELGSEASETFRSALEDAGIAGGIPDLDHSLGWSLADLLLHGLELAGCDATQQEFMAALHGDDTWDNGGLFPQPFDFGDRSSLGQECSYYVQLQGEEFVPVEDASPLCGERIDA
ncbi:MULTISPECIES: ABC transporter substrate-binding protein [unclassified Blastococcus]